MRAKVALMAMGVVAGLLLWMGTGCEEADGLAGLSVEPAEATLGPSVGVYTEVFTAGVSNSLALPLEWRVSNEALGHIASQSGTKAVYVANRGMRGENVVTVRDQYGNEGSAAVTQQ